jgi:hypothetical protein
MDDHPAKLDASVRPPGPVWLTYVELGDRLGITPDAARQKAIRGHWRKQRGNDGKARVLVEAEVFQRAVQTYPNDNHPDDHPNERTVVEKPVHPPAGEPSSDVQATQAVLVAMLEDQLGYLWTLVDSERIRADGLAKELAASRELGAVVEPLRMTVQALQSALDAEKQRLAEVRQERDRLYESVRTRRLWWPWRRSA